MRVLALLLVACVAPKGTPRDTAPDDTGADGGTACSDATVPIENLTATVTAMPTVIRVSWDTTTFTDGVVWFAEDGAPERATALVSGSHHVALLTGLHSLTDVHYRVATGGALPCGPTEAITTGALPAGLPAIRASADDPTRAEGGFTVVPIIGASAAYVIALDANGEIVWAWAVPGGEGGHMVLRAALSADGRSILANDMAASVDGTSTLYRVSLDAEMVDELYVTGGHTDFVERARGQYAMLGWDLRTLDDGRKLLGDTLVEFDDTGAQTVLWDAFDWLDPDFAPSYPTGWYLPDPAVEDWTHANGLSYDAAEDAYYVSITGTQGVARIDRGTGAMAWYLSDVHGDFQELGGGALVSNPHSAEGVAGGVLVFNRGDFADPTACSEADEIALDTDALTAETVWSYQAEPCLLVTALGQAHRLAGGNTLVVWSTSGQIDEVTPEGVLAWRVNTELGSAFGFAGRYDTLGPSPAR